MRIAVVDVLARASGRRYATFDVVGSGPRHVAGVAEKYGDVVFVPFEKLHGGATKGFDLDVIFISAMSSDYGALEKAVSIIRSARYSGPIVVGGPISLEYPKLLTRLNIDFVIVGEGEIPVETYLKNLKSGNSLITNVPALAYREGNQIKLTSKPIHIPKEVLAQIKPWTRVSEAYDYPQVYRFYVEVVRGCSNYYRPMIKTRRFNCIECYRCRSPILYNRIYCPANIPPGCGFCSVPAIFGYPRSRPVKSIKEEVEELIAHGARRIVLSAPDFLDYMREELVNSQVLTDPCYPPPNIDAIEDLLNELHSIEYVKEGKAVIMVENIKACLVNEEVSKVLGHYLKGTTVHIGLETACDWYNERVLGKPIYLNHVVKACKLLVENGIRPYVYLMYNLPFATKSVYEETLRALPLLEAIGVEKITLYKFLRLPGTAFEEVEAGKTDEKLLAEIKNQVGKYNLSVKRRLLGEKIVVYLVESGGKTYGYPVKHGPVVFVKNMPRGMQVSGCKGVVRVVDVSDRYVVGVFLRILEC